MASYDNRDNLSEWLDEDNLMLLECWSRDGYTLKDIANRIGISYNTLIYWKKTYPEIKEALSRGREIIDYKVENALLKSALGYKCKEVKVTTLMRYGKVVEVTKEVLSREQAPNVSAIQCWLYNRCQDKWKKNRDNLIELTEEDSTIQVSVVRANKTEGKQDDHSNDTEISQTNAMDEQDEWEEEINTSITITKKSEEEIADAKKAKAKQSKLVNEELNNDTKVTLEPEDDLDYWPEDWEE